MEKEEAETAKTVFDSSSIGPCSAHRFKVLIAKPADTEVDKEETRAMAQLQKVQALNVKLLDMNVTQVNGLAGTLLIRKAHQTQRKMIMCTTLEQGDKDALTFLFKHQLGFKVFIGKPPRQGIHRALQGDLDSWTAK